KMYTDLSQIFAGTATSASVLFLMEAPAQPNPTGLPPTYTAYGVLTITDTPTSFQLAVAGAFEYSVLGGLHARIEATVAFTFTSNSFNITLSGGHFFLPDLQTTSLADAA